MRGAPSRRIEPAASPVATAGRESPACQSIRYCSAAVAAAPPGTTRPSEPLASCEVAMANQLFAWSASRCTSHSATHPATCVTITAIHQAGATRSRSL